LKPASISLRIVASIIDGFLIVFYFAILAAPILVFTYLDKAPIGSENWYKLLSFGYLGIFLCLVFFLILFYFPLYESSQKRGSPGMQVCGLQACTKNYEKLSFGRAFVHCLLFFLLRLLGFFALLAIIPIFFTKRKQTLYDMMSGVFLVQPKPKQAPVKEAVKADHVDTSCQN